MGDLAEVIRSERLALVDLLETLTPQEWATPSLCAAWTVQDVAAHLAWAPVVAPYDATVGFLRAGLRVNRFIADSAVRWSRRGTAAILAQLRVNAAQGVKPVGMPQVAALGDAVVHPLDIRRPLGRPRPIPPAAFVPAADFFAGAGWWFSVPLRGSTRARIAGLRLVADDQDWQYGVGTEVHGSAEALLLLLTGRPVRAGELSGPGAPQLYARL